VIRLRYVAIFLLTACLVGLLLSGPAQADHNRWLPGIPSKVMNKAIERGYVTYRLDETTAAYPNFRLQAAAVAQAGLNGVGIEAREITSGTPDIWLTMPTDSTFISTCGQGAAGCIYYWADPVMIYFRRSLLYVDWKTTIAHEGLNYGHTMGQHEQYFDNGTFSCKASATYTVMSCGTGVWRPQPYDIETVWAFIVPFKISGFYGFSYLSTGVLGYWCGMDTVRGTRVAIMAKAPDGSIYWSGVHRNVKTGCDSMMIEGGPGWCYLVSQENGFNWQRGELRNDTEIGCL